MPTIDAPLSVMVIRGFLYVFQGTFSSTLAKALWLSTLANDLHPSFMATHR
jgi:hypothetical protein